MRFTRITLSLGLCALLAAPALQAQESAERYIPIGQSPGLSNGQTYIGTIERVDTTARTVTVRGPQGSRTVSVSDNTRIWIDRSAQGQFSLVASLADLKVAARCEVSYQDLEKKDKADWIKMAAVGGQ